MLLLGVAHIDVLQSVGHTEVDVLVPGGESSSCSVAHSSVGGQSRVCLRVVQAVGVSKDVKSVQNLDGVIVLLFKDSNNALASYNELLLNF